MHHLIRARHDWGGGRAAPLAASIEEQTKKKEKKET